jgi:hypothetical protein
MIAKHLVLTSWRCAAPSAKELALFKGINLGNIKSSRANAFRESNFAGAKIYKSLPIMNNFFLNGWFIKLGNA